MEVQTFFLCKDIIQMGDKSSWDARQVALHSFHALDNRYPLIFTMSYYMLLRRVQRAGEEQYAIRFNLVDADGRNCGIPNNVVSNRICPSGHLFCSLHGTIEFAIPRIGDYRLDVTADETKLESIYPYNIEITERPL